MIANDRPLPSKRSIIVVVLLSLAVRVGLGLFSYSQFVDDAYIFMRYAENFAQGHGLAYNPGEPVMAFTSPLFAILMSVLHRGLGFVPIEMLFRVVSWLFWALTATALVATFRPRKPHEWVLTGGLLLYYPIVDASLNGMETSLYLMLIALSLYASAREDRAGAIGWSIVASLTRPEGVLLFLASTGAWIVSRQKLEYRRLILPLALAAGWVIYATSVYGSPLPQSMLAKSSLVTGAAWAGQHSSALQKVVMLSLGLSQVLVTDGGKLTQIFALVAALAALIPFFVGLREGWRSRGPSLVTGIAFLLNLAFYIVGDPVRLWSWYVIPTSMLFLYTVIVGIRTLAEDRPRWGVVLAGATAAVSLATLVMGSKHRARSMIDIGGPVSLENLAAHLKSQAPKAKSVMLGDIGIVGYRTGWYVVDLAGLVTPAAVGHAEDGGLKYLGDLIESTKPDVICLIEDPRAKDTISQSYMAFRTFRNTTQKDGFLKDYEWNAVASRDYYPFVFVKKTAR